MADGYEGTVEDFTNAHRDVVAVKESVEAELKKVWDEVLALQSLWTGEGQRAFDATMLRYDEDSKNLNAALEAIAEQLMAAGSTYQEQEQSKQDVFGNLGHMLNGNG